MKIWLLIPIKSFKRPKSRLNDVLTLVERKGLVQRMLKHIIKIQQESKLFDRCLIVTEDKDVLNFIKQFHCHGLLQKKPGLNQAVKEGALEAKKKKVESLFIMHGDIPQVDKNSLIKVINYHKKLVVNNNQAVTLIPDELGEGSNCMICSPPNAIPFNYGIDSCSKHLEAADKACVKIKLYNSVKLSSDIDKYNDLDKFLKIKKYSTLQEYLDN